MKTNRLDSFVSFHQGGAEYVSPLIEVINLSLEGAVLFHSTEGGFGPYVPGNGNGEDI